MDIGNIEAVSEGSYVIVPTAANRNNLGLRMGLQPWQMASFGECPCANHTNTELAV
jgi:hypothetical protein